MPKILLTKTQEREERVRKLFRIIRIDRGMRKGDIAEALNMSRPTVKRMEEEPEKIPLGTFWKLLDMAGIPQEERGKYLT